MYAQLPVFFGFLILSTARSLILWWIYHVPGEEDGILFNTYWVTQFLVVAGRGLVAAEICWLVLRAHPGVWALSWRLLAAVGIGLVGFAVIAGVEELQRVSPFVLRVERSLELSVIGLLVALFAVCRYYDIRVQPAVKYLAIGLGLHAVAQVVNDTAFYSTRISSWWAIMRPLSFNLTLLVWCWALRKPVALAERPRELQSEVYEKLVPEVNLRLRRLNERLLEMLK
jgi:hypothetical protein